MAQITIILPDGSTRPLISTFPYTAVTKAEQVVELLGQDVVNLDIEANEPIEFLLGTQILVFGYLYTLNVLPEEDKQSTKLFKYKAVFEGSQYDLLRSRYFNVDATGNYTGSEFSITGKLEIFVETLVRNLNRTYGAGTWTVGNVKGNTPTKTLSFSSVNCLEALQQTICKEFEVEFDIVQTGPSTRHINVNKAGNILNDVYEYGQGKGLYNLTRRTVKETSIVTRLYPYGSSENLKADYRGYSTRLKIGNPGSDYLEDADAIARYGLIEAEYTFEDIKPHREGTVTELVSGDLNSFIDSTMDFDLNEKVGENTKYLVAGKSAKIHFNSGNLAGYEFEILDTGYDNTTKKFTIIPFTDERGLVFPNATSSAFQIAVGDTYVILDIVMPDVYITNAEAELRTKGQNYLDANKDPLVSYGLTVDPIYLRRRTDGFSIPNFFNVGDYIKIKDTDLNIDKSSRVISFTRDVLAPFVYSIQIADSYQSSTISRVISDVKQIQKIIEVNNLKDPTVARQNWKTAQEAVNESFDPDGYLKDGKIRAESIEAAIALIGTDGQQFQLVDMKFMPNYDGQQNVIRYSSGKLVHLTVDPNTIITWNINGQAVSLGNDSFKYVYARCNRNSNVGTILFSEQQIKTKQDSLFYHFLIGILSTVDTTTQTRELSLSYGFTLISGGWITTGAIKSRDGSTIIDLDNNEITGNIKFRTPQGINKPISDLEVELKALIADVGEQVDGQILNWFLDGLPTLANAPAIEWNTQELKELHLGDLYYDQISGKSYRFRKTGTEYSWQEVTDDRVTQALILASKAQDTADGKRRIFITQPLPPYDAGDLWTNGTDLFRCITQRLTGSYNPLDWALATVYDNTVTTINGGVAVTGALYLANEDGTLKAGIRGGGQGDNAILLFLGASPENAEYAPMRARRGGALELRSRLELFDSSNNGVAGICGQNNSGDGSVNIWSGKPYAERNQAPFKVDSAGAMTATKGNIGTWRIEAGGIVNDSGDAYLIARSSSGSNRTEAMIGSNVFPDTSPGLKGAAVLRAEETNTLGDNVGLLLSSKNGSFRNFALYAADGIVLSNETLSNGSATFKKTITTSVTQPVDFSLYEFIAINNTSGGVVALSIWPSPALPIKDGKEVRIFASNNSASIYLTNILRGASSYNLPGGAMITLTYFDGFWYSNGVHDNNW